MYSSGLFDSIFSHLIVIIILIYWELRLVSNGLLLEMDRQAEGEEMECLAHAPTGGRGVLPASHAISRLLSSLIRPIPVIQMEIFLSLSLIKMSLNWLVRSKAIQGDPRRSKAIEGDGWV